MNKNLIVIDEVTPEAIHKALEKSGTDNVALVVAGDEKERGIVLSKEPEPFMFGKLPQLDYEPVQLHLTPLESLTSNHKKYKRRLR